MALATNLGFPRIGPNRELKKATEAFWAGKIKQEELEATAKKIRRENWAYQKEAGLDHIPSNDFSFYDQVLDTAVLLGAVPERYRAFKGLEAAFAMARGKQTKTPQGLIDLPAMEMTKWFDTNYHYIVPELSPSQTFLPGSSKIFDEWAEAAALGIKTRPVLMGPFTFLKLSKSTDPQKKTLSLLPSLLPVYQTLFERLATLGVDWIQLDEPALSLDLSSEEQAALIKGTAALKESAGSMKILLASYFGGYGANTPCLSQMKVNAVHVDLVRSEKELDTLLPILSDDQILSAGVIDGRNIWKNNFKQTLALLVKVKKQLGSERVFVAPSCSLLHSPVSLDGETELKPKIKPWLSFAREKISEIAILTKALNEGESAVAEDLLKNREALLSRQKSPLIFNSSVRKRLADFRPQDMKRKSPFAERQALQRAKLKLPLFPTTTIGSFPQTPEIRAARRDYKKGVLNQSTYKSKMVAEIKNAIQKQEEIGLDVLVHGEPERNDMVEYFGEQLQGFAFTQNGWVQSYGSRCVKPPIIYGDVSRPRPMTVEWMEEAKKMTGKPVKGMLTGPITILQWSFVRDDQPRRETASQIALAIRDEVLDLEKAGSPIIQIDEAAIREGLPLRRRDWPVYLDWAVKAFRLASSGAKDQTQIHTHMCYSEFNDMIEAIAEMDADVVTIEASRSGMELLKALKRFSYPNEIGPGVYDIHSPRVPSVEEIKNRVEEIAAVIPAKNIWINPDCGLKTRNWPETIQSLKNLVQAAKEMRSSVKQPA